MLLGVSRGSDEPPKLIVMKYEPRSRARDPKTMLASSARELLLTPVHFSEPGENMELMKYDMTGAATVIGTMRAIAQLKPSIPCSESRRVRKSAVRKATKPGDVLRA